MTVGLDDYERVLKFVGQIKENGDISQQTMADLTMLLFDSRDLKKEITPEVWFGLVEPYLKDQISRPVQTDRDFYRILMLVRLISREGIVDMGKRLFFRIDPDTRRRYESFYNSFDYFWGRLDGENDVFDVLERRVAVLENYSDNFLRLYNRLADYRSKKVLMSVLSNWLTFDYHNITDIRETVYPDYCDADIYTPGDEDVFVDLGAYNGDSTRDFIERFGHYKRIYCYEITHESVEKMRQNLSCYRDIDIRRKGVGAENCTMKISSSGVRSSANLLGADGEETIEVVSLDNDIQERIGIIKMDIEGAEKDAILGASKHIVSDRPKLLISVYHGNTDYFEIPALIDSIRGDYRFYLRSTGYLWAPAEIVLYAV